MSGPQLKSEVQSLVRVFESLFSAYLARATKAQGNQAPFLSRMADLRKKHVALEDLTVDRSTWQVKLSLRVPVPADDLLDWLAETMDGLVDVSLIEFGNLGALRETTALARDVLSRFGDEPARLGIPYSILSGSLVRRRPMGLEGLDGLLDDGIPDGHQLLLASPSIPERDSLFDAITARELKSGGKALRLLVSDSPAQFAERMGGLGLDVGVGLRSQRLVLIDWRPALERPVSAVEMTEGLCRAPESVVHLETAVAASVAHLNRGPGRAFIDLTEVIQRAGVDQSVNLLKALFRRLRRAGMTTIYCVDEEAVGQDIVAGITGRFDGLLRVRARSAPSLPGRPAESGGAKRWEIGIETLIGASFNPEFRPIAEVDGSLVVGVHSFGPLAAGTDDGDADGDFVDIVLGRPGGREADRAYTTVPSYAEIVELWKLGGFNVRPLEVAREAPEEERAEALKHFEREAQRLYAMKERYLKGSSRLPIREELAFLRSFTDSEKTGEIEARLKTLGVAVLPAHKPAAEVTSSSPTVAAAESAPTTVAPPTVAPPSVAPPLVTPHSVAPSAPPPPAVKPAPLELLPHAAELPAQEIRETAASRSPPAPARGTSAVDDALGAAFAIAAKSVPTPAAERAPPSKSAGFLPDLKSFFTLKAPKPAPAEPARTATAPPAPPATVSVESGASNQQTSTPPSSQSSPPASAKPARALDSGLTAAFGVNVSAESAAARPKPAPSPATEGVHAPLTDRIASLFKDTIVSSKKSPEAIAADRSAQPSLYMRERGGTTQARSSPIVRKESGVAPVKDAKKTLLLESALERVFGVKIKPAPAPPKAEPGKPLKSCRVCEFELPWDENPCRYCGSKQ